MSTPRSAWTVRIVGLLVVISLPIAGTWVRRQSRDGCALDGSHIEPLFEVRIIDERGFYHRFCCVQCAEWWLDRQTSMPQAVLVTDESSGQVVNSATAHFVRSSVITTPTTGNRVHAFQRLSDARRHAEVSRGTLLLGAERPFGTPQRVEPSD